MRFRLGQRVTPKRGGQWLDYDSDKPTPGGPRLGQVFMIIEIKEESFGQFLGFMDWTGDHYHAAEFRLVTDISVFTAMLERESA